MIAIWKREESNISGCNFTPQWNNHCWYCHQASCFDLFVSCIAEWIMRLPISLWRRLKSGLASGLKFQQLCMTWYTSSGQSTILKDQTSDWNKNVKQSTSTIKHAFKVLIPCCNTSGHTSDRECGCLLFCNTLYLWICSGQSLPPDNSQNVSRVVCSTFTTYFPFSPGVTSRLRNARPL